jgi:hypothetical protein
MRACAVKILIIDIMRAQAKMTVKFDTALTEPVFSSHA